jgi:hypothetical protein
MDEHVEGLFIIFEASSLQQHRRDSVETSALLPETSKKNFGVAGSSLAS